MCIIFNENFLFLLFECVNVESNEIGDSMQDGGINMPQKGRRAGRPKKQKGMNSFKKVEKAFWDQSRKKKISGMKTVFT